MCSDRLNNSMDVAQQRDIDIDRPSAQWWPRWQNLRGVFDNVSLTQLLGAYRMESLLDSYVSDNNSEAGSVVLALSAKVARKNNTKWQLTLTASIVDDGSQRQRCLKCTRRFRPRTWTHSWIHLRLQVFWWWTLLSTIHGLGNCWHPERMQRR